MKKFNIYICAITVAGQDYLASAGQLVFATGDNRVCHEVTILNDDICERPLLEDFFSTLSLVAGKQVIVVDPERARVIIDDSEDCRELIVVLLPANHFVELFVLYLISIWYSYFHLA